MERIRFNPRKTTSAAKPAPNAPKNRTGDVPTGYKNPPVATRFKSGTSGNPGGRPKGVRSLKGDFREALNQTITVDGEKITQQRAMVDRVVGAAAAGDIRTAFSTIALIGELLGAENERDFQAEYEATKELGGKIDALRTVLAEVLKDHMQNTHLASVAEMVAFCFAVRDASGAPVADPKTAGVAERMKTSQPYFQKGSSEVPSNANKEEDDKKEENKKD